jgi:hypothetical protein
LLLDFGIIKGNKKKEYFAAVQSGMDRDCEPMAKVFYCCTLNMRDAARDLPPLHIGPGKKHKLFSRIEKPKAELHSWPGRSA